MCGICCAVSFSVEHFSRGLKEDLLCNLKRRGPNSSKQLLRSSVNYQCLFSGHVLHLRGVLTAQPVEDERGNVFLWNGEVFSGIKVEAEENDTQIMFHYLCSCKNESDILSLFSKVQGPWSFIYYQASSHSLWFGRDFFGRRSLLWHFSNLGKSFCLSSVGTQASGVADQWQEVPASGIFRIDLKSVSISQSVVLKLYPWKYNSGGDDIRECVNSLTEISADLPTFVLVAVNEAKLYLKEPVVPLNKALPQAAFETHCSSISRSPLTRETLRVFLTDGHTKEVVEQFIGVLSIAVKRRVLCLPRNENLAPSDVLRQLLINPTDLDIGRVFTCRSVNEAIPSGKETSIELNVHHPPTVTLSIEPQTVQEGERVIFTCQATANPEILGYRWAKGGFLIEDAHESRYETNVDYSFFTEPVSCEVHNKVGSTNVSTLVNVHFAPRIVVDPKPTTTDIGSDVTLTCVWVGNPPLTLTWTKKDSNMVLSNSNQLLLKSVTQADAGTYTCRAIVPRIGVAEREVPLYVNGPPIISSEAVQYAVRGDGGKVECFIGSTPPPDRIAWAWKENFLEVGTLERYTVERTNSGSGVLSTLTINNVMEADFQTHYNCTAWNSFGPGTAIIQLEEREVLPVGIIAGATIGAGILLIFFFIALVFFLYRRRKGSRKDVTLRKLDIKVETVNREPLTMHSDREDDTASVSTATRVMKAIYSSFKDDVDLKQDLRCDTIDTREEYEMKDPTNGYYNVRAHEDRPSSRAVLYADYRAPGPARFDGRPSSRLSHSSGYAQLNTYSRAPAPDYGPEPTPPGPAAPAGNDTASQLSYENYEKFNSHPFPGAAGYPTYRLGYPQAPPSGLERTPYEAYDPIGKYATATRFSYTSQHSDYGQRFQQRMQTHV